MTHAFIRDHVRYSALSDRGREILKWERRDRFDHWRKLITSWSVLLVIGSLYAGASKIST